MIQAEEKNDVFPLCPHCNQQIVKVYFRKLTGVFGRRYVYFCAQCSKVLGLSHRKGFWMG